MKTLKIATLIAGLLIVFAGLAIAEEDFGNIHKGNVQTGGGFNFTYSWVAGHSNSMLQIVSPTEYFFLDRLSLGATVSYYNNSSSSYNYDSIGVGPSGTYYFWTQDRLAAYLAEELTYNKQSGSTSTSSYYFNLRTKLGMKYFVTPSVAVGPSVEYAHFFGRQDVTTMDSISLFGSFSIYF